MNRSELVSAYVDRILDSMSTKDLLCFVGDQLEETFANYSDAELTAEIEETYPDLLEP